MSDEKEEWKDVIGFEGKYKISNYGNVLSICYNNTNKTKPLSSRINHGYKEVILCKNGLCRTYKIHRLVAMAFLSNPEKLPCVNHKDENKLNNYVDNLEWCTCEYNNAYGTARARVSKKMTNHPSLSKKVVQISKSNEVVKEWVSIAEVQRELGIRQCNIVSCCKGKRNTCGGFIWKYKETCSYK